jgi:hypothetical protein
VEHGGVLLACGKGSFFFFFFPSLIFFDTAALPPSFCQFSVMDDSAVELHDLQDESLDDDMDAAQYGDEIYDDGYVCVCVPIL